MTDLVSRIRMGSGRRTTLGLVVALLLATAVDAGMWAVRHGGTGVPTGKVNTASRGPGTSSLINSGNSHALLVGAGHGAAYFIFWGSTNGELQGQITQDLIVAPQLPGQKVPGTATTGDSFTGTIVGSKVRMRLAGDGLNGVTLIRGQIRSGHLLLLADPVAGRGVIAFRTEKNLNRFTSLFNRMYYGMVRRLNHGKG